MRRPGARTFAAKWAISLLILGSGLAPTPAAGLGAWQRPVAGRVVRPFEAPAFRFGPGHLGVDLAAAPGSPVRAAGAGTVVFAGAVADTLHVVISHVGDLRTSYSFLASIRVHRGEELAAGAVIGTAGGRGEQHHGPVLHVGLRIGDTYADPMRLFGPPDLAAVVHLAPVGADRPDPVPARGSMRALGLTLRAPIPEADPSVAIAPPAGIPVLFGRRTAVGTPLYPR